MTIYFNLFYLFYLFIRHYLSIIHLSIFYLVIYYEFCAGVAWSPVFEEGASKWAWFLTLQRSGHVVIWKAQLPLVDLQLVTFHDLDVKDPFTLKIHRTNSGNFLFY